MIVKELGVSQIAAYIVLEDVAAVQSNLSG